MRLIYRFPPHYVYPLPPPPNAIMVLSPVRAMNERRQLFSVVEDLPDDASAMGSRPNESLTEGNSDNSEHQMIIYADNVLHLIR
jgi:hypothetical protein